MTDAPPPAQPAYNQQPAAYGMNGATGPAGSPTTGEDPGRILGIVALVLAFLFSIAGLITGIIARKRSKEAGYSNGFAKWAIILSIVFMVLGAILAIVLVVGGAALVGGAIEQACEGLEPGTYPTTTGESITCP